MKRMSKLLCMLLAVALALSVLPSAGAASHPFTDVAKGSWYEPSVEFVHAGGLMNGTGATTFSPDLNMSRAMVVTVLYRMEGEPAAGDKNPFLDVNDGTYYHDAVVWAYRNQIAAGTSASAFSPDLFVTREQLVTFFYRYASYKGLDVTASRDLSGYTDQSQIADYARDSFRWAVKTGIITGTSATTLSPRGISTRAQCATILMRFIQWSEDPDGFESTKPTEAPKPTESTMPTESTKPTESTQPTQSTEPVEVAAPVTPTVDIAFDGTELQDIRCWSGHTADADRAEPLESGGQYVMECDCNMSMIEEYVAMLQENGYTLVDTYTQSSFMGGGSYYAWGLTCDTAPDAEMIGLQYAGTPCHVSIWTSPRIDYRIDFSLDLTMCDLGIRRDSSEVELTPQGESLGAGLLRLSDGSYMTSDGRLTASTGTAVVVRDGVGLNATASFELDGKKEILTISGYDPEEEISLTANEDTLVTGKIYSQYELEKGEPKLCVTLDGEDQTVHYNGASFETSSMRLMYAEEDGDAVYYIYAKSIDKEPGEIEALAVVNAAPVPEEPMPEIDESKLITVNGNSDETITMSADEFLKIEYSHRELDSAYHTFEWEITEGADNMKMYGSWDSRTFIPSGTGVVVVRMTYCYTKEEPDVLTGIPRDNPKSRTRTYSIIIE